MWIVWFARQVQGRGLWEGASGHQQWFPMCERGIGVMGESGTNQSRNFDSNLAKAD